MKGLLIIWMGQIVSGIASSITAVALPIWIFNLTGSGTAVGLLEFFFFGSYLLFALFAGVLIDRYNRKMMMLVYDFMSLSAMAILLVIQTAGFLHVWHLYLAAVFQGVGFAFQSPSYSAAIAAMVPQKTIYPRQWIDVASERWTRYLRSAPGWGLYLVVGLNGILALNLLAFVFSIGALLFVDVPSKPQGQDEEISHQEFLKEALYGIKYILKRPGLLGLQLIFFMGNLFSGIALSTAALYPMILLRTGNDAEAVGIVQSVGALMAVLGSIFLTSWGGIKRPINAILIGWIVSSLFGLTFLGLGQVFFIWLIGMAINSVFEPVVNVSMDAFLQTKIPPDVQGRVFSASDFLSQALIPFTPLLAGLFGDRIFEPAMHEGGSLANVFGRFVGTGPGAGFGLLILLCGIGGTLIGLSGYLVKEIRDLDRQMPDYHPPPPVGLVRRIKPVLVMDTAPASFSSASLEENVEANSSMEENQKMHPDE